MKLQVAFAALNVNCTLYNGGEINVCESLNGEQIDVFGFQSADSGTWAGAGLLKY